MKKKLQPGDRVKWKVYRGINTGTVIEVRKSIHSADRPVLVRPDHWHGSNISIKLKSIID
jgi:hypothetical protein